jgi:hypothetical protein
LIGTFNKILVFNIEDERLLNPQLIGKINFIETVCCIAPLNKTMYLVGQERGFIDILNIENFEIIDPTFVLITHAEFVNKTHVYTIQKTGEPNVFAVGTYKGLFILRIDPDTF